MTESVPFILNLEYEDEEKEIINFKKQESKKKYKKLILIVIIIFILIILIFCIKLFDPIPEFKNYSSVSELNNISKDMYPKRLLIFVVTSNIYLSTRAVDVVKTWQRHANILNPNLGIYVVLSVENNIPSRYNIPTLDYKKIPSTNYEDLYIKVFDSWTNVWKKYGEEFDYFMKADDDLFINVEKLGKIFNNTIYDSNKIEYFGFRDPDTPMCWGGPGYILSKAALRTIYPNIEKCKKTFRTGEDIALWQCIEYSYKLTYNKQFKGCSNLYNMKGTEFLALSENDFNWNYWNRSNETFKLSYAYKDLNWSFNNVLTIHSTKPKENKEITMLNLEKVYGYN